MCRAFRCVHFCPQAWLPQYEQLAEESPEKAVAGVQIFGWVNNTIVIGVHRGIYDGRVLDAFGGFAEFRRVWRRYVRLLRETVFHGT